MALNRTRVVFIPRNELQKTADTYPGIATAFWRDTAADAAILAKWVGNFGSKDAAGRVAHLFCALGLRFEAAGLGQKTDYQLDMSQAQLGEATGFTAIHVNRVLRSLRERGMLDYSRGRAQIQDWNALSAIAEFNADYLLVG